jgi:hypothetical protein
MSDLVFYAPHNPDPQCGHCLVTGETGDGVLFPTIEPQEYTHCFVGRQAIMEAMSELYNVPVDRIKSLMDGDVKEKELKAEIKALRGKLSKYQAWVKKAEDAGLALQDLE